MEISGLTEGVANMAGDLTATLNPLGNPLGAQLGGGGHLSVQDRAFLDAFNRQEQQELHEVPKFTDSSTVLCQLEQTVQSAVNNQRRSSILTSQQSFEAAAAGTAGHGQHRQHEIVTELAPEEVRWFYKREAEKEWTPFMGYDSLRIELRYRHIWQTKWAAAANAEAQEQPNTANGGQQSNSSRGRRSTSLNRNVHYETEPDPGVDSPVGNKPSLNNGGAGAGQGAAGSGSGQPANYGGQASGGQPGSNNRGRHKSYRHYRSADTFMEEDRDMRIVVRGGVYEVDLAEWKCHSIYWPGEAFDIQRGTWFQEITWQPLQCEYADRIEQEHLNHFRGHKMADYVWDSVTQQRLEKQVDDGFQVNHTMNFTEFHVDWMSPEEVYLHRENTSSQLYRGISASLGFRKPVGERLFRGYKELCSHTDRLCDITHLVFVVHGVGQVVDDTTILRNTNLMRDNLAQNLAKNFPKFQGETGQRAEFFPVEWRSSLRLDDGMVQLITPNRIMGLRNLLNSSAMDIMYYTSPLYRMEIWHALQEELNRLYEMFVQRNPYFETNGGKVSIVAHSLGCVVTYDILTGWTQDVEHSWYNLQTRGGGAGIQDLKRSRRFRHPSNPQGGPQNIHATPAQSGLLFRIENFFCLGSPLAVFLSLRWRDPQNQEYHEHILPRSLCKYLYNVYHPCDPVAYRVEPIFMRFYSQIEPVHLFNCDDPTKIPYGELPLQPLQVPKKGSVDSAENTSILPVNIANGSINISMGKMASELSSQATHLPKIAAISPSLSLPKLQGNGQPSGVAGRPGTAAGRAGAASAMAAGHGHGTTASMAAAAGASSAAVGDAVNQVTSGIWGLMKDATASLPSASNMFTSTTTTTSSSSATTNIYTPQPQTPHHPQVAAHAAHTPPIQEVKPPDGQRLAYRMDYVLKEAGNTYISAITSHTAYWCNPDVAYFMLTKIHPELEKKYAKPVTTQPLQPQQQQQAATTTTTQQQYNNISAQQQQQLYQQQQQYNYNQGYNNSTMQQQQQHPAVATAQQQPPTQHVPRPHPHYAHLQQQSQY